MPIDQGHIDGHLLAALRRYRDAQNCMTTYPVLISIADPWQVVTRGLVEVVKFLRRLELPSFLLS